MLASCRPSSEVVIDGTSRVRVSMRQRLNWPSTAKQVSELDTPDT